MAMFSSFIDRLGRESVMTDNFTNAYPPAPGLRTFIYIERYLGNYMTYGVVLDALRGIVQFKEAYPAKNGEIVALIRIPPHPEAPIGHITFHFDDGDDSNSEISAGK